ncbi:hypothetical protein [Cysteiniphilum sp. QT6929]|uniref:hypothetical protein n=1 Tax=Cysteiniphilum sp. QT6929 TaxID=2975055 RepID=UPI0024B37D2E|nr:hypothetical protein [Cysteiniphilum sp. QT6929]WHN66800.1 hypothetical protein NYP54_11655 [Cysteiniphilum sp. QT6929]
MNDHQKERLLKIAETNPELAKDVVDILKQESLSSHEPIAVKMVKSEEDKIEVTAEQRNYAVKYLITLVSGVLLGFLVIIASMIGSSFDDRFDIIAFLIFIIVPVTIFLCWFFAYKAGMPTVKTYIKRHFKFL